MRRTLPCGPRIQAKYIFGTVEEVMRRLMLTFIRGFARLASRASAPGAAAPSALLVGAFLAALAACGREAEITQPRPTPGAARASAAPAARYRVTILPALGGSARGNALNARGWVAGFANLPDGTQHAALWRDGAITDLGT